MNRGDLQNALNVLESLEGEPQTALEPLEAELRDHLKFENVLKQLRLHLGRNDLSCLCNKHNNSMCSSQLRLPSAEPGRVSPHLPRDVRPTHYSTIQIPTRSFPANSNPFRINSFSQNCCWTRDISAKSSVSKSGSSLASPFGNSGRPSSFSTSTSSSSSSAISSKFESACAFIDADKFLSSLPTSECSKKESNVEGNDRGWFMPSFCWLCG